MWIKDECDSSACCFDFRVHLLDLGTREVLGVELEVLEVVSCSILICPSYVRPDHIEWVAEFSEVSIPLHKDFGRNIRVLAEVVAEGLNHRHGGETRDCCQICVHVLDSIHWSMFLGGTSEDEELKCAGRTGEGDF